MMGLGFTAPWLLLGLLALPVLWLLLRAVPPAPIRRRFPGVALLLGLRDDTQETDRTPWWLLALRMLAVATVITGLAGPVLAPDDVPRARSSDRLLILTDASWASAADWAIRQQALNGALEQAQQDARPVALMSLSDPVPPRFLPAEVVQSRLAGVTPQPWTPLASALDLLPEGSFDTLWLSDGLAHDQRAQLLEALSARGTVRVLQHDRPLYALAPVEASAEGTLILRAQRLTAGPEAEVTLIGRGLDPSGNPTVLVRTPLSFAPEATEAETEIALPAELRARLTRFEIDGNRSAGAVTLTDESLSRREIALFAGREGREGLELLSPLHYLHKALEPTATLLEGTLPEVLPANPDVIVLADVARLPPSEAEALRAWVENGGLLVRFAGPILAASDLARSAEDPLLPVRLRAGGRSVGGAMSWGDPKAIAPFDPDGPFAGLVPPADVTVSSQVMAQPDPTLADRVLAQLTDGTPLVTRKTLGQGRVVLFHVTANAEWSSLPLSGLFVSMLDRLAVTVPSGAKDPEALAGTLWMPDRVLDAFGRDTSGDTLPGVDGAALVTATPGPTIRPGIYTFEDKGMARNLIGSDTQLSPAAWPAGLSVEAMDQPQPRALGGWLLALALLALAVDVVATLALSGRLRGPRAGAAAAAVALALLALPQDSHAQPSPEDAQAIAATSEVVLAHVLTGNARVDELAQAGLMGLSDTLFFRTSIEPAAPMSVDLETDELAFFPMLYWPITADQPIPSAEAYGKLNAYLRSGGLILFDTRDADVAGFGTTTPEGRRLQEIARALDMPALEPIPQDHVLTRTFYLLQEFPGRYNRGTLWVEAAPPEEAAEGMPFRNLNDNVTPVVIGGNDWASAWATDADGNALVPIGQGFTGERQREIAHRFGVNLMMHVLTGNYKSDQVHVPALLDRLGN